MKNILRSSADENKISLTIKGVGVAIIPVLVFVGGFLGLNIVEADLTQLVNAIATLISAGMIVYGLGRKLYIKIIR